MKTLLELNIISKYISQEKIDSYAKDLEDWFSKYELWELLGLADHFAIKVEDEEALQKVVNAIKPYCFDKYGETPGLSIRKMDGRLVATALLRNPLHIKFNQINCIEIMQPKPENIGKEILGLDHLEFINSDFDGVQKELKKRNIPYGVNVKNGYKKTIIVKINAKGEEVKFTNKTLAEVVPLQIKDKPDLVRIILPNM